MTRVFLKKDRAWATAHGHPWIFSGAIERAEGNVVSGETVDVRAADGAFLGYGAWSPVSQIRVRMLSRDPKQAVDSNFVRNLVASSVGRRADFWVDGYTNAVRLINAENDGLPGVIADCYDGWIVVQLASAGAEKWREEIAQALMDFTPEAKGVYERSDVDARTKEGLEPRTGVIKGDAPPELIGIHEGGVAFLVDVRKGHKTGFYLDQREARAAVARYANGADVLNCFSYTGGFGLFARAAGALHVTHLDLSSDALALAKKNTDLAHLCGTSCDFVEADVFKQLRAYRDAGRTFDLIVLDPPKFASSKAAVMKAARGYKDINVLAMKLLNPNGVLATFSCSGAMTEDLFLKVVSEAAFDAGRNLQILQRTRQAVDHPVALTFPEGLYLKGLVLRAC